MFIAHLRPKFPVPSFSGSLVTVMKRKV